MTELNCIVSDSYDRLLLKRELRILVQRFVFRYIMNPELVNHFEIRRSHTYEKLQLGASRWGILRNRKPNAEQRRTFLVSIHFRRTYEDVPEQVIRDWNR